MEYKASSFNYSTYCKKGVDKTAITFFAPDTEVKQ